MIALIMAGGGGTRFWPLSRRDRPKQVLNIAGDATMIEQTVERLHPLVRRKDVFVITTDALKPLVRRILKGVPAGNILGEPSGRNTAPCIAYSLAHMSAKRGSEPVAVLPADHFIADVPGFLRALRAAGEASSANDSIVTIGAKPTRPDTGYGYILKGVSHSRAGGMRVFKVVRFEEKPGIQKARRFLGSGDYYWNCGIFVARVEYFLGAIRRHMPVLHAGVLDTIAKESAGDKSGRARAYARLDSISMDYGVMEKERSTLIVPASFGWSDVGTFEAVHDIHGKDRDGNVIRAADSVAVSSTGNYIHAPGKTVAVLGLDGIVLVDTPDAILVCRKEMSQDIRKVVDALKARGRTDLT